MARRTYHKNPLLFETITPFLLAIMCFHINDWNRFRSFVGLRVLIGRFVNIKLDPSVRILKRSIDTLSDPLDIFVNFHNRTIRVLFGRLPRGRGFFVNHLPRDGNDVILDQLLTYVLDVCNIVSLCPACTKEERLTLLGIDFANISRLQLILAQLRFFLDSLLVALCEMNKLLHAFHVVLTLLVEVFHLQCLSPYVLVKVHQHVFFQSCLAVIDCNAVVVTVEAVDESLN